MKKTTGDLTVELVEENKALKSQLAIEKEKRIKAQHYMQNAKKNLNKLNSKCKALKSQLANIKYLNADEVEKIFNDCLPEDFNFEEEKILTMTDQENIIQAICKLAIPDIDDDEPVNYETVKRDIDNVSGIPEHMKGTAGVKTASEIIAMRNLTKEEAEVIDNHIEKLIKEDTIPDIDRDKIVEVLDSRFKTQLRMYLIELYSVTGKLTEKQENDIKDYMKKSADQIIKAIRKD